MNSLNGLGLKIQHHLEQHRPKLYRSLQDSGKLKQYVLQQQNDAEEQLNSLEESGLRPDEAMERIQNQIFPPSEEDLPNLNGTMQPYQDQPEQTTAFPKTSTSRRDRRRSSKPTSKPSSSSSGSKLRAV